MDIITFFCEIGNFFSALTEVSKLNIKFMFWSSDASEDWPDGSREDSKHNVSSNFPPFLQT